MGTWTTWWGACGTAIWPPSTRRTSATTGGCSASSPGSPGGATWPTTVQETWIRLATRAADLREDTQLGAWLFRVARNLCVSFHRARLLDRARLALFGHGAQPESSPFDLAAAAELERRLEAALAGLPLRYREVVLLVAVEGLTAQQAAEILRLTPEAVRQRLLRGRGMIEKQLAADGAAATIASDAGAHTRRSPPRRPPARR
jgi:RNA polymerase sigma-70 factor, ECF subfamily